MNWFTKQGRTFAGSADRDQYLSWLNEHLSSDEYEVEQNYWHEAEPDNPWNYWQLVIAFSGEQFIQGDQENITLFYEPWNNPEEASS